MDKEYLTMREASQYLRLTVKTLYGYTSRRIIPFIKLGTGRSSKILFSKEELDKWIADRAVEPVR